MYDYPYGNDSNEILKYIVANMFWMCVWVWILQMPSVNHSDATFRLNFVVGFVAPSAALLYRLGCLSDTLTTPILVSYFIVDTVNISMTPNVVHKNKLVDYFHHVMCLFCALYADFGAKDICRMDRNPFVDMMFAEISTPFLQLWRKYKSSPFGVVAQLLFVSLFMSVRVFFHGFYTVHEIVTHCDNNIALVVGILYMGMNLGFCIGIVRKLLPTYRPASIDSIMSSTVRYSIADKLSSLGSTDEGTVLSADLQRNPSSASPPSEPTVLKYD